MPGMIDWRGEPRYTDDPARGPARTTGRWFMTLAAGLGESMMLVGAWATLFGWWLTVAFVLLCAALAADDARGAFERWSARRSSRDLRDDAETARIIERWRRELA